MTAHVDHGQRLIAASLLLTLAVAVSLLFQGITTNLVYLALTTAALLAALACVGTSAIAARLDTNRGSFALALAMLGYLIVVYRFSIRADNSFGASWVLAAGPLAFIGGSVVMQNVTARRLLTISISTLIIALAAVSSVRFALFGERAHQPLDDPNNYATLMYLVWIPLAHRYLAKGWSGEKTTPVGHACLLASSFVLVFALIATRSRTAMVIVGGVLLLWIAIAVFRRTAWKRLFALTGTVGLALIASIAVTTLTDAPAKGLELGGGLGVRYELMQSARAMFEQHPMGIGVFCFPLLYPSFRSLLEQDTAGLFVHNDYVQFLVEGGVPLLVLLLLFVGSVLRRARLAVLESPRDARFEDLGVALAVVVACAHAMVNFVFYSLTLVSLIGLLSARLFSQPIQTSAPKSLLHTPNRLVGVGIAMGWLMWLYLALDVATAGVFQNQPSLGLVRSITANEARMLEYARVAQRLNGNRGIPVIAEAVLLHRAARAEPESKYLREQAYLTFHRALAVDPWNTLTYVRFSEFLDDFVPAGGRAPNESTEELLYSAIGLNPMFVPGIDGLLRLYSQTSQESKSYALLRNVVYPWMGRLRREDPDASDRYLDRLDAYAGEAGDSAFLSELKERRKLLADIAPRT